MTFTLFAIFTALASITILFRTYSRAKMGLYRLHKYEFYAQKFFGAARSLTDTSETPDSVVEVLEFLNECIVNEPLARGFFETYERVAVANASKSPSSSPDVQEFVHKRPELEKVLAEALESGVLAMTFLNDEWGVRGRALFAESVVGERRTSKVMATLKSGKGPELPCARTDSRSYA